MHSKIKQLFIFILLPLLLGANHSELTEKDIQNNKNFYEVINATTGEKETSQFYAEDEVVKTHGITVSALRKALDRKGFDASQVRILLYYDPIAVRDDLLPRMWNSKSHPNTITSPWLDVTKIKTTSGKTKITIRIDATSARVVNDLFSKLEKQNDVGGFLSISPIRESCFLWIGDTYSNEKLNNGTLELKQVPRSFDCVLEELREPLLFLFELSHTGLGSLVELVIVQLNNYCQDTARQYYSELYPSLALRALQILENKSKPKPKWWIEIFKPVEQTEECQA